MTAVRLDRIDAAILRLLQADARLTAQELSARVGLSASQVARRRQRLEETGVIRGWRAEVDPARVGIGVEAFVQVVMATHDRRQVADFVSRIRLVEEIVAAWTLTGASDYLLRLLCADLAALNRLVQEVILPHPAVSRVQSQIVLERLKENGPVPLG
ncbi:MAG: AsnC family transcriptional regulator [Paracoccaceae bacterium]|nr:MAG: Lrp/AsnC family transcriptional regulator [Alphaproteobacteria bacterium]GIX12321.1 MAG: AsnC family transcriptional regulator [Paracoccaceae bacterium]